MCIALIAVSLLGTSRSMSIGSSGTQNVIRVYFVVVPTPTFDSFVNKRKRFCTQAGSFLIRVF